MDKTMPVILPYGRSGQWQKFNQADNNIDIFRSTINKKIDKIFLINMLVMAVLCLYFTVDSNKLLISHTLSEIFISSSVLPITEQPCIPVYW